MADLNPTRFETLAPAEEESESSSDSSGGGPRRRRGFLPDFHRNEMWAYFGPAFVASVAYIDPGNFATNILGGTQFGYRLLWVLLWSNAMAMLIQYLSAKLGIVTGLTLPQNCRKHFSRPATIGLWVAAEIAAIATDLAEFLGAAIGLDLLFGPLLYAHGFSPKVRTPRRGPRLHSARIRHSRARPRRLSLAGARHHGLRRHHRPLLRL